MGKIYAPQLKITIPEIGRRALRNDRELGPFVGLAICASLAEFNYHSGSADDRMYAHAKHFNAELEQCLRAHGMDSDAYITHQFDCISRIIAFEKMLDAHRSNDDRSELLVDIIDSALRENEGKVEDVISARGISLVKGLADITPRTYERRCDALQHDYNLIEIHLLNGGRP